MTLDAREQAIRRIRAKREFRTHLMVYVAVNALLVLIWFATGAGYFWPMWPILGWGIAIGIHAVTGEGTGVGYVIGESSGERRSFSVQSALALPCLAA